MEYWDTLKGICNFLTDKGILQLTKTPEATFGLVFIWNMYRAWLYSTAPVYVKEWFWVIFYTIFRSYIFIFFCLMYNFLL